MLTAFFLYVCRALDHPELCFDVAQGLMRPLRLPWPPVEGPGVSRSFAGGGARELTARLCTDV